jgi:DNA-3-methyladenine glycosylase
LAYYQSDDVTGIARDLLGKILVTRFDGQLTAGRIVETEAYMGPIDRASHAWNNRRTARTEVMFSAGGVAYIYLCYGIHHMMNVVTGPAGQPHAVLIRALEPLAGLDVMARRRDLAVDHPRMTVGPGALSRAMGLHVQWSGTSMTRRESPLWIEEAAPVSPSLVCAGPRIGVDYAGDAAAWPWRFFIRDSAWVSARRKCT